MALSCRSSELWIRSMRLEPAARRCLVASICSSGASSGPVRLAGERGPQRHEELGALAPGALLQYFREHLQIRDRLDQCIRGGSKKTPARGRDDALLSRSQRAAVRRAPRPPSTRHPPAAPRCAAPVRRIRSNPPDPASARISARGHPLQHFLLPVHELRLLETRRRAPQMLGPEMRRHLRQRQPALVIGCVCPGGTGD